MPAPVSRDGALPGKLLRNSRRSHNQKLDRFNPVSGCFVEKHLQQPQRTLLWSHIDSWPMAAIQLPRYIRKGSNSGPGKCQAGFQADRGLTCAS